MSGIGPSARCLDEDARATAVELLDRTAAGNAVVVAELLAAQGVEASVRTVQRAVSHDRKARRAAELATVRFETAPGHQMQIDFGEKFVSLAGAMVKVFFFVAVLSFSRRIFVKPLLNQRQDDWREGLFGAFRHFGGVTQTILIDTPERWYSRRCERQGNAAPCLRAVLSRARRRRECLPPIPCTHQGEDRIGRRVRETDTTNQAVTQWGVFSATKSSPRHPRPPAPPQPHAGHPGGELPAQAEAQSRPDWLIERRLEGVRY